MRLASKTGPDKETAGRAEKGGMLSPLFLPDSTEASHHHGKVGGEERTSIVELMFTSFVVVGTTVSPLS